MADTARTRAGRIQGLDVLRGLAVALVLVQHAFREMSGNTGIVGVIIFFALSGYLITGLLLNDLAGFGAVRYRRFYKHRALRLLPALVLMLAAYVAFQLLSPWGDEDRPLTAALIGITYTADLPHLSSMTNSVANLWSLAVEEQFYLVWPALLLVARRHWRIDRLIVVALVGTVLAACAGPALGMGFYDVYPYPTSWAVALVVGAAAKVHEARIDAILHRTTAHLVATAAAGATLSAWCLPWAFESSLIYVIGTPLVAASAVVLIFWVKHWSTIPTPALRPLLGLGVVSYAAYLWNLLISDVVKARDISDGAAAGLAVLLTVVAATASWFLVERPVREWRNRSEASRHDRTVRDESRSAQLA